MNRPSGPSRPNSTPGSPTCPPTPTCSWPTSRHGRSAAPQPAPPGHVADATLAVRGLLAGRVRDPRVIYGGSAQPGTFGAIRDAAGEPAAVPDGVFMARFGLDPKDFLTVVREVRGKVS